MAMNIITVNGAERAMEAGAWARENIKHTWQIGLQGDPFKSSYAFIFADSKDATIFALRWR